MAIAEDRRRLATRLGWLRVAVLLVFGLLAGVFWFLQVAQHAKFQEMAENNHQRTLALRAPRGVIYDRTGQVLVENRSAFNISIVREHTKDLDRTDPAAGRITGIEEAQVRETVERHKREPSYRPIVVVQDATLAQVAAVTARRLDFELPDVVVQEVPTRQYPSQGLAAHLIGYVGEASDQQMSDDGLASGAIVGQSGVERVYNRTLMGEDGARRVVVNSVGREIRELEKVKADRRAARAAVDQLRDAARRRGRVPRLWLLGRGGGARSPQRRRADAHQPASLRSQRLLDRHRSRDVGVAQHRQAAAAAEPRHPGPLLAGLDVQDRRGHRRARRGPVVTPDHQVFCPGGANFYGRYFKCHLAGGHGWVDMRHALEKSCNVYFYTLGNMLGVDRLHEYSEKLGLAGKSGIDLPNEIESIVPVHRVEEAADRREVVRG